MKIVKLNPTRINLNEPAYVRALAFNKNAKSSFKLNVAAAKMLGIVSGDKLDAYVDETDKTKVVLTKGDMITVSKINKESNSDGMLMGSSSVVINALKQGKDENKIQVYACEEVFFNEEGELCEQEEAAITGIALTFSHEENKIEKVSTKKDAIAPENFDEEEA